LRAGLVARRATAPKGSPASRAGFGSPSPSRSPARWPLRGRARPGCSRAERRPVLAARCGGSGVGRALRLASAAGALSWRPPCAAASLADGLAAVSVRGRYRSVIPGVKGGGVVAGWWVPGVTGGGGVVARLWLVEQCTGQALCPASRAADPGTVPADERP